MFIFLTSFDFWTFEFFDESQMQNSLLYLLSPALIPELRADVATLKEDVEIIKEDVQVTRNATNTLLDWAEQAQLEVKIPLYKKAE